MYKLETFIKYLANVRFAKIIFAIDSVAFFLVLIIIARIPPANGYEISIYDVYPWFFWVIISILLASPLIAIVLGNMSGQIQFTYLINVYALLSIFVLLTLPAFRGYPFYGAGDTYSHIGWINEISFTGHVGSLNPYPGMHILINILAIVSSCIPETISLYITQILLTLYIVFISLLARSLRCSRIEYISITSFAILPALGYWLKVEDIIPSTDAFFLIPLVLFCIIKGRLVYYNYSYSIISVLLLILFPFFHVEPTLFLFIALIVLSLVFKINGIRSRAYTPAIILLVGCFTWFSSTLAFSGSIQTVYNALILGLTPATPPLQSVMSGFRIGIVDAINGIIRMYGPALVYLAIGGYLSLHKLIKFILKNNVSFSEIFLSALLFVYAFLNLIFLSKGTAIGFHIFRQAKYSIMISTFIIGLFFSKQSIPKKPTIVRNFFLILFIIAISILMVYSIYPSPSLYTINCQPTYSDIAGMNFFFSYRNDTSLILEPISRAYQTRWAGKINISDRSAIRWGYNDDVKPPNHFGYDRAHLGDFYNDDQYLLIYPPCETYYPTLYPDYPELWDFSPDDFKLLNKDPTVDVIYSNYDLKIMLVHS